MPGSAELLAIRRHIANHYEELRKILAKREFRKLFGNLEGEVLSRPPKGFSADHPAIDWLRYKQFLVSATYPSGIAETPKLLPEIDRHFQTMMPLVRFLNSPLKPDPSTQPRAAKRSSLIAEDLW